MINFRHGYKDTNFLNQWKIIVPIIATFQPFVNFSLQKINVLFVALNALLYK